MNLRQISHFAYTNSFVKLTLAERRRFHTAVQVFRVLHHLCPGYLRNWFVYAEAHTGHGGRNKHRLFIPQINISIGVFYHAWSCDLFPIYSRLMSNLILNLWL